MVDDSRWERVAIEGLAQKAAQSVCAHLQLDPDPVEITVLACDDARITELNSEFREKPSATNVLSWPAEELAPEHPGAQPQAPTPDITGAMALGDIAISYDTCLKEAETAGKPMADHVMHLLVHGILHLLGFDHIRDQDATLMEGTETAILGKMGIDDPYGM